jgi:hypothetical protein
MLEDKPRAAAEQAEHAMRARWITSDGGSRTVIFQPPLHTETSDDGELAKIGLVNLMVLNSVSILGAELTVTASALSSMQTSLAAAKW